MTQWTTPQQQAIASGNKQNSRLAQQTQADTPRLYLLALDLWL